MPEVIEAPTKTDETPFGTNLGDAFSDLDIAGAFDGAFPSTKQDEKPDVPVKPEAPKPPPEKPSPAPVPKEGEVPESVFGEPTKPKEPEIEVPKSITKPEAIASWKELRGKYDESKKSIAQLTTEKASLEEKLKAGSTDEGLKARVSELESQNRELSESVQKTNLERHPAFQARFVQPRKQLMAHAQALVKEVGGDPASLEKAMALSGKPKIQALDEFLDGIESPTVKTRVSAAIDQIDNLDAQANAVLADSKGSYERLSQHDKAEQSRAEEEQNQRFTQIFDATVDHLRDKAVLDTDKDGKPVRLGLEVLKKVEGADWWNKQGDSAVEAARQLMFKTSDPKELAAASLLAATSGIHRALWLKEREQRVELAKQLADHKGAEPNLNGSRPETPGDETEGGTFAERVAKGSGLR